VISCSDDKTTPVVLDVNKFKGIESLKVSVEAQWQTSCVKNADGHFENQTMSLVQGSDYLVRAYAMNSTSFNSDCSNPFMTANVSAIGFLTNFGRELFLDINKTEVKFVGQDIVNQVNQDGGLCGISNIASGVSYDVTNSECHESQVDLYLNQQGNSLEVFTCSKGSSLSADCDKTVFTKVK
jgi:hypothetical protein